MDELRPNPDEILKLVELEEEKENRGKLKIYFGYAAGVGKTYTMLKAAADVKKAGVDVVLGYIEPHVRPDTMALMEGLEQVPVKKIKYHGIELKEMNIDAILERKPELVLVDEYAHSNAAGSRHKKRYQDVEEILRAGIDVYTTVNVQHIESLCDIVASITGIIVRERIPDSAFDRADEVQLTDIEPADLMKRLEEGKIYQKNQAQKALAHFFTVDKLTALREIALRKMADRINRISETAKKWSGQEYYTEEKILIGLSSSPSNPKIIRTGARMAQAFGGELIGVYVETSDDSGMSEENKKRLKANIHLAEQMGAKIETVYGDDIPYVMAEYARTSGISKIVVGRTNAKRVFFQKASFTDKLTMYAPNIDVYIIPDRDLNRMKNSMNIPYFQKPTLKDVWKAFFALCFATAIGAVLFRLGFSNVNIIAVYMICVILTALTTANDAMAFVQSLTSVFLLNFCFVEPRFSIHIYDKEYLLTFLLTFLAALFSGTVAIKMKNQERELARAAYRTRMLLEINQRLQNSEDQEGIGRIMAEQLSGVLNRRVIFYPGIGKGLGEPIICGEGKNENENLIRESEKAVAEWVYKNNKRAGATTGTLDSARCYYLAIRTSSVVYGVAGIEMGEHDSLTAFENNLIFAVLSEAALAIKNSFGKI